MQLTTAVTTFALALTASAYTAQYYRDTNCTELIDHISVDDYTCHPRPDFTAYSVQYASFGEPACTLKTWGDMGCTANEEGTAGLPYEVSSTLEKSRV
ncbi:MAG: hypothetical protein Q9159_003629 [Coniocarpon cinnabarinum]